MKAVVTGSGHVVVVVVVIVNVDLVIVTENVDRGLVPETGKGWFCCCPVATSCCFCIGWHIKHRIISTLTTVYYNCGVTDYSDIVFANVCL